MGAAPGDDGTVELNVWAPKARTLDVHTSAGVHALERDDDAVFSGHFPGVAGDQYLLALDGAETYPDPCSRFQPYGVRGPSEVVDPAAFEWTDAEWQGVTLDELVVHQLHVGTFSEEGTFEADEDANRLHLRRGDAELVADFRAKHVEVR